MSRSERLSESMSAFMDGEAPRYEGSRLMAVLKSDAQARQCWANYHLISDAIRNNLPPAVDEGLADRVAEQIAVEPSYLLRRRWHRSAPQWVKQAGGLALVASVTAITILGVQSYRQSSAPTLQPPLQVASSAASVPGALLPPGTVRPVHSVSPRMLNRVNSMVVNHNEVSSGLPMQGVMPYARLVNYESGR
jgi:sigma-E factor negative regulatory protein RseA